MSQKLNRKISSRCRKPKQVALRTVHTHLQILFVQFKIKFTKTDKSDDESVRFVFFFKNIFEFNVSDTIQKTKTGSEKAAAQNQELQMQIAYKFVFAHTTTKIENFNFWIFERHRGLESTNL